MPTRDRSPSLRLRQGLELLVGAPAAVLTARAGVRGDALGAAATVLAPRRSRVSSWSFS
jgi:hypothetical protein